jgi:hypothetical protein
MEKAVIVDIVETSGNLLDYVPDLLVRERIVIQLTHLHHTIQIHI